MTNPSPPLGLFVVLISLPASLFSQSSPPITYNHITIHFSGQKGISHHKKDSEEKNIKRSHSFFSPPPFFDFCFFRNKSQRILLVILSCQFGYGRLYEKILSRQEQSSTWTLKPASRSPSASSLPPIGTAKRRPQPPKRLTRSSRSIFPTKPDGKVNTLLFPHTLNYLPEESTSIATARKRSVIHVRKNVTTVPVSTTSITFTNRVGEF